MIHYHPEFGVIIDHERDSTGTLPKMFAPLVLLKPEVIRVHDSARIDSFCKVEGGQGVVIGRWVHVASFCHLNIGGGELVMEEGSGASSGVKIITGSNDPAGESCSAVAPAEMQVVKHDIVFVGRNAILFTGAIILPGVTIGEGAVIGAGSLVNRDVPPFQVWVGNPARYVRMREGHEQDTIDAAPIEHQRDGRRVSRKR